MKRIFLHWGIVKNFISAKMITYNLCIAIFFTVLVLLNHPFHTDTS